MLLLTTELWKTHGGVQRYMRTIAEIFADQQERFSVLTLLDGDEQPQQPVAAFAATYCRGSKWRFCAKALLMARTGVATTTIVGHVALLPVVWALQQLNLIKRYAIILHGIEAWHRLSWISRIAARNANAIVATTKYTIQEFCFHNDLGSAKCLVIPLACSFHPMKTQRVAPLIGDLKILSIGRLSKTDAYKGLDTVLLALRRGRDAGLKATLSLVGCGDDRSRLEHLASSLGVQKFVRFHGSVCDQQLHQLLEEAQVFVLPSKKEGFGIVFLEAMAMGLPCIGANHGGIPEVIEHGDSGFLIEYGDADALAFYLQMLFESPELLQSMSAAARRRYREAFSLELMSERWKQLIKSLQAPRVISSGQPIAVAEDLPSSAN